MLGHYGTLLNGSTIYKNCSFLAASYIYIILSIIHFVLWRQAIKLQSFSIDE
jgi:hypothetical protein